MNRLLRFGIRCLTCLCLMAFVVAGWQHWQEESVRVESGASELPTYGVPMQASGGSAVLPQSVDRQAIGLLARRQARWLAAHMDAQGALPYIYYPEGDRVDQGNQMPRQWLATLALGQWALHTGAPKDQLQFMRNLHANLSRFLCHMPPKFGTDGIHIPASAYQAASTSIAICHPTPTMQDSLTVTAHLASAAVAAEALHIAAAFDPGLQEAHLAMLRTIQSAIRPDGAIISALSPHMNDAIDAEFGMPAAIIALAHAMHSGAIKQDSELLTSSIDWLWQRWPEQRSLYGAPWLLLALEAAGSAPERLYEVADYMLSCQQTEGADIYAWGSFNKYPCGFASNSPIATAMRAEGLAAARRVAAAQGDKAREKAYKDSIQLALRLVMQYETSQEQSLRYTNPAQALNSIGQSTSDSSVRVDAPGHVLSAALGALQSQKPAIINAK